MLMLVIMEMGGRHTLCAPDDTLLSNADRAGISDVPVKGLNVSLAKHHGSSLCSSGILAEESRHAIPFPFPFPDANVYFISRSPVIHVVQFHGGPAGCRVIVALLELGSPGASARHVG
jgi:hypothetical protein